jgi:hypothetical protein
MTTDREAIVRDRQNLKVGGEKDMVQGYEPTRPYSVVTKKYVDSNVDLDGGFANSVYLISQISDGGGA